MSIDVKTVKGITINGNDVKKIEDSLGTVLWTKTPAIDYMYIENTYAGQNTITFTTTTAGSPSSSDYASSIEYSKDKDTWTTLTFNTSTPQTVVLDQGEKLFLRNDSGKFNNVVDSSNYYYTSITGSETHDICGKLETILDYTNQNAILTNGCFAHLFSGDNKLVDASDLYTTNTTIPHYAFDRCFYNCSQMTSMPDFDNVVTVGDNSFNYVCYGASSLTLPSDFSNVTTCGDHAFNFAFVNATSMTYASDFSSLTSCGNYAFDQTFRGCTRITTCGDFSSLTSVSGEYIFYMTYSGCSALTDTPDMSKLVGSVGQNSFYRTFDGCSNITTSPDFTGLTTATAYRAFYRTFYGCSRLNTVYAPSLTSWSTSVFDNWMYNVASTGNMYNYGSATIPTGNASGCPYGWTVVVPPNYLYIENTHNGSNTVSFITSKSGSPSSSYYSTTVEYNTDLRNPNWTTLTLEAGTTKTVTISQGEKLYLRNDNGQFNYRTSSSKYYYTTITGSQNHNVGGNLNSILNYTNMVDVNMSAGAFYSLFSGDTTLINANNLKITNTALTGISACFNLFNGCSGLVSAPDFSNMTTLGVSSFNSTFRDCVSLVNPANMSGLVTVGQNSLALCYSGCSLLAQAPDFSNITTAGHSSFNGTFTNCVSLVNPADTSSITTTDTGTFYNMYNGCTSLQKTPLLNLSVLTTEVYKNMFYGCSSLNKVYVYADDISAINCILDWLYGVAQTGTFYNNGSAVYQTNSSSGIPTGWTIESLIDYMYVENTYAGANTITFTTTTAGSPSSTDYSETVEYSTDLNTWTTMTFNTSTPQTVTLQQGEKLYLRNDNGKFNYYYYNPPTDNHIYTTIKGSQSHNIGGNLMSIVKYTDFTYTIDKTGCFCNLFKDDTTLVSNNITCPSFSNVIDMVFYQAFRGCSAMVNPPDMSGLSGSVGYYSLYNCFRDCSSMTTAPDLSNLNGSVAEIGFQSAFNGCSSMTTVPDLSNLNGSVGAQGFQSAFNGCSSITSTPDLRGLTSVSTSSFSNTFKNCSSLSTAYVPTLTSWDTTVFNNWLDGVAATGTIYNYGTATIPTNSASGCPTGWSAIDARPNYLYIENTYSGSNSITFMTTASGNPSSSEYSDRLQYSLDNLYWTTLTLTPGTSHTFALAQGEKLYLRNDSGKFNYYDGTNSYYTTITGSETHSVGGDILSLYDYNTIGTHPTISKSGCFSHLFDSNTGLVSSHNLIFDISSIGNYGLYCMFYLCSQLVTTPDLSNITSIGNGGMESMFRGCAITTAPDLTSITTGGETCMNNMFRECRQLVTATDLSLTSVGYYSLYRMYMDCTSLATAPDISSIISVGASGMRDMFNGCTQLVTAPDLSNISNVNSSGLREIFRNCSSLSTVFAPTLTSWSTSNFNNWLYGVAASGTIYNYGSATIPTGSISGCPTGWTVSTTPPTP